MHGKTKETNKKLDRNEHIRYILRGLNKLSGGYAGLDASQPWLIFWMLQSLHLLKHETHEKTKQRVIATIATMQNPDGGFGGGPGQISHLAATYAAVSSLMLIGNEEAYNVINKETLYKWFLTLKQDDGSFLMTLNGEVDIRGAYCVLSVSSLLNLNDEILLKNIGQFIKRCQGFDGGLGCYPGVESHGGYTYCGLASLELLNEVDRINLNYLMSWCCNRQMDPEGGFQGRTNKLVDGCYSFWIGATFPILSTHADNNELYNRDLLQAYILNACQGPLGGLRDKPGKGVDYYHTCYVLSGLSLSQYKYKIVNKKQDIKFQPNNWEAELINKDENGWNLLVPIHPLFNIPITKVNQAYAFFYEELHEKKK
ncbi:farnesyltransferase subunit beta-like protein [Neoconidiobolus thromboides FSU 785]|nr:farnesyltransferase subunit beta-like protein [Neoconidiobolus thromboides FSU 785]